MFDLNFSKQKRVVYLGDTHGEFRPLYENIIALNDVLFIHVGDLGVGFNWKKEEKSLQSINAILLQQNSKLVSIRGNHDDPALFDGKYSETFTNIYLAPDYTTFNFNGESYQLIGGAVSIDRTCRVPSISYWVDEGVKFLPELLVKSDVLVTHSAPTQCTPVGVNNSLLNYWFGIDDTLREDLIKERKLLSSLLEVVNPKLHVYGHFHSSKIEKINSCVHKLLDIHEMWSYEI